MKITDLETLDEFMSAIVMELPGMACYLALSNGEKAVNEISAYYNDHYQGTTAFFQVAEVIPKDGLITFMCSLTIATQPEDTSARAGLAARNLTLKLILELLGKLQLTSDESVQEIEDEGDMYDMTIEQADKIFPIGLLANVNLEGHYVDLDVTIPITHLMYPQ